MARLVVGLMLILLAGCGPEGDPSGPADAGGRCGELGASCCPGAVPCLDGMRCTYLASQGWGMPSGTCAGSGSGPVQVP